MHCNGPLGKDMSSDELCTVWQVGSSVDTKEKYTYIRVTVWFD